MCSLGDDPQAVSELRVLLEIYVLFRPRVINTMGEYCLSSLWAT